MEDCNDGVAKTVKTSKHALDIVVSGPGIGEACFKLYKLLELFLLILCLHLTDESLTMTEVESIREGFDLR